MFVPDDAGLLETHSPRVHRLYQLHAVRIPILRAIGFAIIAASFFLHNRLILEEPEWRRSAIVALGLGIYCMVSWLVLRFYYRVERTDREWDVSWLFHLTDVVACAAVVWASGGERSWMFLFLLVPVWNQTHYGALRAVISGAFAAFLYLAMLLVIPWLEQRPLSLPLAALRSGMILLVTGYCALSALLVERGRAQVIEAMRQARRRAEERAARLSSLNRLTHTISSANDLPEALDAIAREMVGLFGVNYCAITMRDEEQTLLRVLAFHSSKPGAPDVRGYTIPYLANPSCNEAIDTQRPVVVSNAQTSPMTGAVHDVLQVLGVNAIMVVPLVSEGDVIGTISLQTCDREREFSAEEIALAETAAGQVAPTVRNAMKYESERRSRNLAERLQAAARAMNGSLALDVVLGTILDHLNDVVEFDAASIQIIENNTMHVVAVRGLPSTELGRVRPLEEFEYNRRLASAPEPVILHLAEESTWKDWYEAGYRTVMGLPLVLNDRIIGAMSIDSRRERAYFPRDTEAAMSFARFAALAVEHARIYEILQKLTVSDALTGLANRRSFDETFASEWRRAARTKLPLSLMLIDVDDFKSYNDHYGHPAGDLALQQVAAALQSALHRAGDFVARYGGEEFVVLLPATDRLSAAQHAERLRQRVEQLAIVHEHARAGSIVTTSIGVATALVDDESEPAALLIAADEQLYNAKEGGRNRVATAELIASSARNRRLDCSPMLEGAAPIARDAWTR